MVTPASQPTCKAPPRPSLCMDCADLVSAARPLCWACAHSFHDLTAYFIIVPKCEVKREKMS